MLSLALVFPVVYGYVIIMEAAFHEFGATSMEVRFYILISVPLILFFTLAASVFSGRSGHFKAVLLCSNGTVLLTLLGLVLLYKLSSPVIFGIILVLLTTNGSLINSVGLEFLAEVAFPTPEPLVLLREQLLRIFWERLHAFLELL